MTRFRCRPVEVEAHRFFGLGHSQPVPEGVCTCPSLPDPHCHTIQGPVRANVGDWIVTGKDEFWPVEASRFFDKYEPVE